MLWIAAALAAPFTPVLDASAPHGLGVSFGANTDTARYLDADCEAGQCEARGLTNGVGGDVQFRVVKALALYATLAHLNDTVQAAGYNGTGWGYELGLKAGVSVRYGVGFEGWVGYGGGQTSGEEGEWEHGGLSLGAVGRFGEMEDGVVAWLGLQGSFGGARTLTTIDGTLPINLVSSAPIDLTAGVLLLSDPVGPPWDTRSRVGLGLSGFVGHGVGGSASLLAMF